MPTLYGQILGEAHAAATIAGTAWEREGNHWFPCGFAWVTTPGTSALVRWCRLNTGHNPVFYGSKGYPKGWQWWCPGQGASQSMEKAERCARAFAAVLEQHGFEATVNYRAD